MAASLLATACGEWSRACSGGEEKDARSRKYVNILAEDAGTVAAWLVPRMRGVRGNGKYFKCASLHPKPYICLQRARVCMHPPVYPVHLSTASICPSESAELLHGTTSKVRCLGCNAPARLHWACRSFYMLCLHAKNIPGMTGSPAKRQACVLTQCPVMRRFLTPSGVVWRMVTARRRRGRFLPEGPKAD